MCKSRMVALFLSMVLVLLFGFSENIEANVTPIARNDTVHVEQNGRINIDVLANDTDSDGDSLASRGPLNGATHSQLLVQNTDGTIHYRPELEFVGQDSFAYLIDDGNGGLAGAMVYITVVPFYRAIDDTLFVRRNEFENFPVLANDHYDRDADSIYVTSLTLGTHSQRAVVNTDQTVFYEPQMDFLGVDTLRYTAETTSGRVFDARMFVQVVLPSFAVDDTVVMRQGGRFNIAPLTNDWVVPGDTLRFVGFGQASHSERLLENSDGTLHYRPLPDFIGTDQFRYTAADLVGRETSASVVVEVLPLNQALNDTVRLIEGGRANIDVLQNDIFWGDVPKEYLSFSQGAFSERVVKNTDGTLHYRPQSDVTGADQFTYDIPTGFEGVRDTATVVVEILAKKDVFFLKPDTTRVFANQSIVIDPVRNDGHVDNSSLKLVDVNVNAYTEILEGGLVFFRPTTSWVLVRLNYTVEDDKGWQATQEVIVFQRPENALGYAVDDSVVVGVNDSMVVDVAANDQGGLHLSQVFAPQNGLVQMLDGKVKYVPHADYEGPDSFVYLAADDEGGQVASRVEIVVTSDPDVLNPPDLVLVVGDFDGDEIVGFADFLLFATHFGRTSNNSNFDVHMDFDSDGQIAFADFLVFIGLFGTE